MKTKWRKLDISAEKLKKYWLYIANILLLVVIIITILWSAIYYNKQSPTPIQIDVGTFGGKIIATNQISGLSNVVVINSSFDYAIRWRSDAIMVYNAPYADDFCPDIQIYRPYRLVGGTFQYAAYKANWKGAWKTYSVIYDQKRKVVVCYPGIETFFWGWIVVLIIVLIILLLATWWNLLDKLKN
jgi:hypothetical protein